MLYSEWYGDMAGYIGEGILVTTGGKAGAGTFPRDILIGKAEQIISITNYEIMIKKKITCSRWRHH